MLHSTPVLNRIGLRGSELNISNINGTSKDDRNYHVYEAVKVNNNNADITLGTIKESLLNNRTAIDDLMETQRFQLSSSTNNTIDRNDSGVKSASTPTKGSEISSFSGFNTQGTFQRDLVTKNIHNILSRLNKIREACQNNNVTNLYDRGSEILPTIISEVSDVVCDLPAIKNVNKLMTNPVLKPLRVLRSRIIMEKKPEEKKFRRHS